MLVFCENLVSLSNEMPSPPAYLNLSRYNAFQRKKSKPWIPRIQLPGGRYVTEITPSTVHFLIAWQVLKSCTMQAATITAMVHSQICTSHKHFVIFFNLICSSPHFAVADSQELPGIIIRTIELFFYIASHD